MVEKGYRPATPDRVPFATADSITVDSIRRLPDKGTEVIRTFLSDSQNRLKQTKEAQLKAYLQSNATKNEIKRLGNAFGFNGRQFTLGGLSFKLDGDIPGTRVALELLYSDYLTYRVTAANAKAIYNRYGLKQMLKPGNTLWDYAKDGFQKLVHCGFGIGVMVHTMKDNKLIITVRTDDESAAFLDGGKLAESANESVNALDLATDYDKLKGFEAIVQRAVDEELLSRKKFRRGGDLSPRGKKTLWDTRDSSGKSPR